MLVAGVLAALTLYCSIAGAQPAPWALSLRSAKTCAVFGVTEDPHVIATIRNVTGAAPDCKLAFDVSDYDGKALNAGEVAASVPQGQARDVDLALGEAARLPHGEYLALTVKLVADGKPQAELHEGFGFLPKRTVTTPPEASPFGLLTEGNWPLARDLGIRYVRPNWSWDERPMDWAKRYGMAYCPLINEANAFARGELTEKEYADFVRESVQRYKGYVKYWQLGNEFDIFHREGPKAYVESQRIGYLAAKAADPNCVIIGGSITELQCRKEGWPESLQLGLAKWCDIYDFHFYQDLTTTQTMLDYIHLTCKAYHAEKPIWVTETTQVNMLDPDDHNQAEYMFKRHAHLLGNGISVVMWHCFRWPYPFEADKVAATGVVNYQGFARPALFAFAAMTEALDGAKFARKWDIGKNGYAFEFALPKGSALVIWSEAGERAMRLKTAPGAVTVIRPNGRSESVRQAGGDDIALTVSKTPGLYLLPGKATGLE
jgi:hypothetical protein